MRNPCRVHARDQQSVRAAHRTHCASHRTTLACKPRVRPVRLHSTHRWETAVQSQQAVGANSHRLTQCHRSSRAPHVVNKSLLTRTQRANRVCRNPKSEKTSRNDTVVVPSCFLSRETHRIRNITRSPLCSVGLYALKSSPPSRRPRKAPGVRAFALASPPS